MRNMKHWFSPSVLCLAVPALVAALGCATEARDDKKVIIIGIDGMDPRLLEQFIAEDRMPNFERLAADGDFTPLQTSMPPLSPVAWSTFITGMDPGGHGTYDFLHRDPDTYAPVESIYRVVPPGRSVELGSWGDSSLRGWIRAPEEGTSLLGAAGRRRRPDNDFPDAGQFPAG